MGNFNTASLMEIVREFKAIAENLAITRTPDRAWEPGLFHMLGKSDSCDRWHTTTR
jgi:hypothetical protein